MMPNLTGNEHFIANQQKLNMTVTSFWRWAYSNFMNNIQRSVLAEYIVASAIGAVDDPTERQRIQFRPYDLLSPDGWRVEVKCAAYVQSWDIRYPDRITYKIAPAQLPDPVLGYVDGAPKQRKSDVYVFSLYKATSPDQNPLDLDLWEFNVLRTSVLDKAKPDQKTITMPSLKQLDPVNCTYGKLRESLQIAMQREP